MEAEPSEATARLGPIEVAAVKIGCGADVIEPTARCAMAVQAPSTMNIEQGSAMPASWLCDRRRAVKTEPGSAIEHAVLGSAIEHARAVTTFMEMRKLEAVGR
jgi:hypothetical protein